MNRIFFFLHCKDKATFSTLRTFVQKYLNFCAILRVSKTFYVAQHKKSASFGRCTSRFDPKSSNGLVRCSHATCNATDNDRCRSFPNEAATTNMKPPTPTSKQPSRKKI
ncbi:MAG: hypothetical protein K6E73_08925 [Bacteroidales bacterium]|nr:hypothetical protein [Bacteroidales bacterium]